MMRQNLVGWSAALVLLAGGWAIQAAAAEQPASAESKPAATQPANDMILVLLGDKATITQAEFERYFFGGPLASFDASKDQFVRELVERRWLLIYLEEHPDLVPESVVQAQKDSIKQRQNLKTEEDFVALLKKTGRKPESWRMQVLLAMGRTALSNLGRDKAKNAELLKKMFDERPEDFNGTELAARHILIGTAPYETPSEKNAKREKAEKLRESLVSGKLTWEEAVKESTCPTRNNGGKLGYFTRHHRMMETLAEAAFKLEPKQISEVIETFLGFHILQVTERKKSDRPFEDSKGDIKLWLEREPYLNAIMEMSRKYPAIGVEAPRQPPPRQLSTRPSSPTGPATRPAATRPGARLGARPATRPASPQIRPRP